MWISIEKQDESIVEGQGKRNTQRQNVKKWDSVTEIVRGGRQRMREMSREAAKP